MNYRNIYQALCIKRKTEDARLLPGGYVEVHHIVPRSLGGSDDTDNLVTLTAREHYVAHRLLVRAYADELGVDSKHYRCMVSALWFMSHLSRNEKFVTSREYEILKRQIADVVSSTKSGENHWNFGRHLPDVVREKISRAHKGKKLSAEHIRKIVKFGIENPNYGHRWSDEKRGQMSRRLKGRKVPESAKKALMEYVRIHGNPMDGKDVKDFMAPEAYESMLHKRSESMKRTWRARGGWSNNPKDSSQENLERIRRRRIEAQTKRWGNMSPEVEKEERLKKSFGAAISHLKRVQRRIVFYLIVSGVIENERITK